MSNQITTITDKEKIEIMNHFINGGEIEYQPSVTDKWYDSVEPSWNWYSCNYRKKVYNYPLYFEYIDNSECKFIVEFIGLNTGTVIDVIKGLEHNIGYTSDEWVNHTETWCWKQVSKPQLKSEIVYESYRICNGVYELNTALYPENEIVARGWIKTGRSFEIKLGDKK